MKIAIYDLDKTLTRRPTFTSFLVFAARRRAPWRLALLPLWIGAMVGHAAGLLSRRTIKQFGFRVMVGGRIAKAELDALGEAFARETCARNLSQGALDQLATDRSSGCQTLLATAAPDVYARPIGALLGFDAVVASVQQLDGGHYSWRMASDNCYGAAKLKMIERWLGEQGIDRGAAEIRFYSDHASDAPTLAWANIGYAVNPARRLAMLARAKGWEQAQFS